MSVDGIKAIKKLFLPLHQIAQESLPKASKDKEEKSTFIATEVIKHNKEKQTILNIGILKLFTRSSYIMILNFSDF